MLYWLWAGGFEELGFGAEGGLQVRGGEDPRPSEPDHQLLAGVADEVVGEERGEPSVAVLHRVQGHSDRAQALQHPKVKTSGGSNQHSFQR